MIERPSFTVGIEEEYLIVERGSRDLVREPDPAFLGRCGELLGSQVTPEYLQCQVEVGTKPHSTVPEAKADLARMRKGVAEAAAICFEAQRVLQLHPAGDVVIVYVRLEDA